MIIKNLENIKEEINKQLKKDIYEINWKDVEKLTERAMKESFKLKEKMDKQPKLF